ncbi:MAG: hypothetical protein Q9172_002331 [Xanthocarpia lactea]
MQSSSRTGGSGLGGDDPYGSSGRGSSGIGNDDSYGLGDRSEGAGYGSAITHGAGSGNKLTSGVQESTGLESDYGTGHRGDTTDRNEPYSGHREYGSGATGGAGFGNKGSSHSGGDYTYGGDPDAGHNSDPYVGRTEYGSGATGGAGFGNKSSNRDDDDNQKGERATTNISTLIRRFENIIEYKPGDRNAAAVDAYKMEVETAALIRAAEDILSLTRAMKEMWLFGKLQTVGTNEVEERAEENATGVEEGLRKLMGAETM